MIALDDKTTKDKILKDQVTFTPANGKNICYNGWECSEACILTDTYTAKFTQWKQNQGPLTLQDTTKVNASPYSTKTYTI